MIVVSGQPRSGTSLQMIILRGLGFSLSGRKNPSKGRGIGKKKEKEIASRNPDGYWEIPQVPKYGVTQAMLDGKDPSKIPYRIDADVIKLITEGLMRTLLVWDTDGTIVEKIIFCIRDPRELVISGRSTVASVEKGPPMTDQEVYDDYIHKITTFLEIMENLQLQHLIHFVDYGDVIANPEKEIRRLAKFMNVPFKESLIKLVKFKLYRSKPIIEKNKEADRLYKILHSHT